MDCEGVYTLVSFLKTGEDRVLVSHVMRALIDLFDNSRVYNSKNYIQF